MRGRRGERKKGGEKEGGRGRRGEEERERKKGGEEEGGRVRKGGKGEEGGISSIHQLHSYQLCSL